MLLLLIAFRVRLLQAVATPLVEDDGLRKVDAVLVLGGDNWGTRIREAGQLVRAGYAPYTFVSGPEAYGGHESDFTVTYAIRQGFPASYFRAMPNSCDSTIAEASYMGGIFRQQGIHSILLVTSNYHSRRAASLFRKQNPWLQVAVIPANDPWFTTQTWWKTREGQKVFLLEWSKTIAASLGI